MSLRSIDMSNHDIENALISRAAGTLSLQQLPYECSDSSFEFVTDSDVLEPAVGTLGMTIFTKEQNKLIKTVIPYELPSKALKNKTQYEARPTAVPNLDDVQPFMSVPDFVEKPGSELEALLASQHIQNPYPYPGNIDALPSYSAEPPESAYLRNLREHVKHALAHAWKYDPFRCSVKGAFKLAQDSVGMPNQGFAKEEYNWATGGKLMLVKRARNAARVDVEQATKNYRWTKKLEDDDDGNHSLNGTEVDRQVDRQVDEFYGPDGTDLRPVEDDSDEGFSEPNPLTITIVSLPDKSPMGDGITPGGTFQDSGISMDEAYAEYSLAYSRPNTAKESTGKTPSDWPKINVAPLRVPKSNDRWLGLVGDQKQCEWPGRRQGPYDLDGLGSHDADQLADGPSSHTNHENLLPAGVTLPDEPMREEVTSEPSEAAPHPFGQGQPSLLHDNDENSITINGVENHEVSVGTSYSVNEERPQYSRGSIEDVGDNGPFIPASHVNSEGLQINYDASARASRNIPNTSVTTPVNQRIYQIQRVQLDTPATPTTINLHLTPEYNSDVDADDASDGSLEVRTPNSPSMNTQKGQSALGRYIQETKSCPDFVRQNSSTMGLDGSESDELSLISAQQRHIRLEGHTGLSKGVELDPKKSHALFTLSPQKVSPRTRTPSFSTTAPIPTTPVNGKDSASFRPITPFQLGTPAHPDFDSPGTPTPAPKASKAKGKSVMNVFNSPKLGRRSPERATPSSEIVVLAPLTTTPAAGGIDPHRGTAFGSQGLLFQKGKVKERGTMHVINSLKLGPERGSGEGPELGSGHLDDYEDELAGGNGVEAVLKGPKGSHESPSMLRPGVKLGAQAPGGKKVAQAVMVPRFRSRDGDGETEGVQSGDVRDQEPRKKKPRRSAGSAGGGDVETSFSFDC